MKKYIPIYFYLNDKKNKNQKNLEKYYKITSKNIRKKPQKTLWKKTSKNITYWTHSQCRNPKA